MSHLLSQQRVARHPFRLGVLVLSIGLAFAFPGYGQMTPEEHAQHHPEQSNDKVNDGTPAKAKDGKEPAKGVGGGMDMGKMMEGMGKAPPKELYPTLMSLRDLSPTQRQEVQVQARQRMGSGVALLSKGLDRLGKAAANEDYLVMQEATGEVREGLAQFESGLAAQRALAEGQPPRQVALQWFKSEMNLEPPLGVEARGGLFGLTLFHLFTMGLLIAFSLAMVGMYFFKMRRAAALFGRIESDPGSPPPGSAKPLAGPAPPPAADTPGASA